MAQPQAQQLQSQQLQAQGQTQDQEDQQPWAMADYLVKEIRGLATRANAPGVIEHPTVTVNRKQGGYFVNCQWMNGTVLRFDITVDAGEGISNTVPA